MNIVLGVSGGIAAYKAPDLVRRLQDVGAAVRVILTPNAARFVSPLSLAAVSGHGVVVEQWGDPSSGGVDHIELARWADLLLIAPASANILAKLAVGIADDALTTYAVAHRGRIAIAPAMNTFMLMHPTVQQNLEILRKRGVFLFEPDEGLLACGDEGAGRMPDPPLIAATIRDLVRVRDLVGLHVLVTAGPTREAIDPVRYLSNRSSGKMGYSIAEAARTRGAEVTLISGPSALPLPQDVTTHLVTTAREMLHAVTVNLTGCQVLIMAAAVADYAPAVVEPQKIKKGSESLNLQLKRTDDILDAVAGRAPRPFIVAFAAETDAVEENARKKLERKSADLIVANDVSDSSIGFDSEQNEVVILSRDGARHAVPRGSKQSVAHSILDSVAAALQNQGK